MGLERKHTQYPSIHHKFTEILDDNGLAQIVGEPTRDTNILDLIATNQPSSFRRTEIIPGVSDHEIVYNDSSKNHAKSRCIVKQNGITLSAMLKLFTMK